MPFMTVVPLGSLGSTYLDISGHYSDQVARFHTYALKLLENPGAASGGGTAWADLGFCSLTIGDLDVAETLFQKGLNYPNMFKLLERPRHLVGMALVLLKRGNPNQAMKLIDEAHDYAQERGMRQLYPLIALVSGQIRAARGETAQALAEFERAEMLALDLHMRSIVWQARAAAAPVLDTAGRSAEAQAERQAALAIVDEIAGMFEDVELRESFLKNARAKIGT
jgi:tetratricopeptide (TPR) repeat protein